jgi:nitrous oxidase accessory protein
VRLLPAILIAAAVAACSNGDAPRAERPAPAAPAGGIPVPAGAPLQQVIQDAAPGAVLLLAPGEYVGPFTIDKPLVLHGPRDAVLSARQGSTVRVRSASVSLLGMTVRGSGQRFDLMDGGIHVEGEDVLIDGVTVDRALFGILVERSKRVTVRGCTVIGTGLPAMGLRGDGIRLWETSESTVVDNHVLDSRDCVVWYSSRNHLLRNVVEGSRYGTHFMYSHENVVEDSLFVGNEVGVFVMYSRDIVLRRCLLAESAGAAGIGIGLKEAGNLRIEDNWLLANTTGIYVDASPLDPEHENHYTNNAVRFSESAIALHSAVPRSTFADNDFRDNGAVVKVSGRGDALGATFQGNYYDTYRGYDLDGDGRGDVPFEFRRLSTQLEARYPELALLHGAPAMGMVDLVGEVMPLFAPRRLLRDDAPRIRPPAMRWTPDHRTRPGHAR